MTNKIFQGLLALLLICVFVAGCGAVVPDPNDPLIGTWVGNENMFFYYYDVTLVCDSDGTAKLAGAANAPEEEGSINEASLTWRNAGDNAYMAEGYGKSIPLTLDGDVLTATLNLVSLVVTDNSLLTMDIPITLYRQGSAAQQESGSSDPRNFLQIISGVIGNFFGNLFG